MTLNRFCTLYGIGDDRGAFWRFVRQEARVVGDQTERDFAFLLRLYEDRRDSRDHRETMQDALGRAVQ